MEQERDAGAVILDEIAALEAERARIEARIAQRMLDFADHRRRESEWTQERRLAKLEASFAADELSLVLRQAPGTIFLRLAQARRVRGVLPQTWLAWREGVIDQGRIRVIADAADNLTSNLAIIELDERVVDYAASHTIAKLRAWLKRFVARNEASATRAKAAFERRGVYVAHDDDGVSWIHGLISADDGARVDALLTRLAKDKPADDCTLEQRRADLFADLLLGRVDSSGTPTGRSHGGAVIGVTVPIETLAGISDAPGETFDRRLALPAELVRELAAEPGTLFYRLLTDPLGRILDVTETGRFPSRKLRIALDIRDGTCAFPTCNVPAADCDADHVVPSPRGPTSGDNLRRLCRRHHRFKTFGVTYTEIGPDGHLWRLPDGKTTLSEPQHLAEARLRPSTLEYNLASLLVEHSGAA